MKASCHAWVNKKVLTKIDTSNVGERMGDYITSELEKVANQHSITVAAIREMMHYGKDRNHVLVFATSVEHAHNIADEF